MAATYTFDVFSSLDGFGSHTGNWGGYWGKQGPELLGHRLALYGRKQRMVFGANTYRAHAKMLASSTEETAVRDPWVTRIRNLPATVVSTTLQGPLDWPDATVMSGDAVDVVARLNTTSRRRLSAACSNRWDSMLSHSSKHWLKLTACGRCRSWRRPAPLSAGPPSALPPRPEAPATIVFRLRRWTDASKDQ